MNRYQKLAALSIRLDRLGISLADQDALRRIEMTLHRWAEQECGDGNDYGSWAIERDETTGKPYRVHHHYLHGRGKDYTTRTPIADKEAGALKRLRAIMAKYPALWWYQQGDPRGCALYVGRWKDIPGAIGPDNPSTDEAQRALHSGYTNGIAVCI